MFDTIYMVSLSRYWGDVQPENFATDAAGIERIVRQRCERFGYEVESIEVDLGARTVMVFETSGCDRTYYIHTVERVT